MSNCILVYDDEESILEVIKIILEEHGFEVISSTKGENIMQDVEANNPSLILLDIWMKGINGNEVAKQLKSDEKTKEIPIILISALNETQQIAEVAGVDGFLKKPFDMDELVKLVRSKMKKSTLN